MDTTEITEVCFLARDRHFHIPNKSFHHLDAGFVAGTVRDAHATFNIIRASAWLTNQQIIVPDCGSEN